jgi:hypothetical protein
MVRHLSAAGLLRTLHALGWERQGQAMAAPACGCLSACVAASSTLCGVSAMAYDPPLERRVICCT